MTYAYRKRNYYSRKYRRNHPYKAAIGRAVYNNGVRAHREMAAVAHDVVKQYVNTEMKHINDNDATFGIPNVAYVRSKLLNGIGEGTGRSEREGQQIKLKSLDLRCQLNRGANQVGTSRCRIMIVRTKYATSLFTFTPDNIMTGNIGGTALALLDYYDVDRVKQYDILYDRIHKTANDGAFPNEISFKIHREWKHGLIQKFDGVGSSDTAISYGAIYLVVAWDGSGVSNDDPTFPVMEWQSRIRYVDN